MDVLKLVRLPDGSLDLAKVAAATAHLLMAAAFFRMQVVRGEFIPELWFTYGGFAIAHDAYNRATAMVKEFKDRKVEIENPVPSVTTTTTTVTQP